jgi:hypothetical protein
MRSSQQPLMFSINSFFYPNHNFIYDDDDDDDDDDGDGVDDFNYFYVEQLKIYRHL